MRFAAESAVFRDLLRDLFAGAQRLHRPAHSRLPHVPSRSDRFRRQRRPLENGTNAYNDGAPHLPARMRQMWVLIQNPSVAVVPFPEERRYIQVIGIIEADPDGVLRRFDNSLSFRPRL